MLKNSIKKSPPVYLMRLFFYIDLRFKRGLGRWETAKGDRVNKENTVNNGLKKEKTIQTKNQNLQWP